MPEKLSIRLTATQRALLAELFPRYSDRLLLDNSNTRTLEFTPTEIAHFEKAAWEAQEDARSGTQRNSYKHIVAQAKEAMKKQEKSQEVFQIKITLEGIKPPIWRRVHTPDCTLRTLHNIIQIAMGWEDYHLHQFRVGGKTYGIPDPMNEEMGIHVTDERELKLSDLWSGGRKKPKFRYEYDFGDSWFHEIVIEKILPAEKGRKYPCCIEGERACPPEDCGGAWGYPDFLDAIADPEHEAHEQMLEWAGEDFDPEAFPLEEVNKDLRRVR